MTLLDLMDAIQVHAKAASLAATTASGSLATAYDVAVGFPVSKGQCVRIFYGGERETEHMPFPNSLTSRLVGQGIVVRGYWPTPGTDTKRARVIEGEMAVFVSELRTRVLGDSDLGAHAVDLAMLLAATQQVVISSTQYAIVDIEIVVDFDEYTRSR